MSLKTIISKIGEVFTNLFSSAEHAWKHLSPEIQNAMLHGSGILAIINSNINKTPAFVQDLILKKFPGLTVEKLKEVIKKGSEGLTIAEHVNSDDLLVMIENLQKYLGGLKGQAWAKISHFFGLGMAVFLAPPATKVAAIASLLEAFYHLVVKDKI
jgi:hypothetical protein